MRINRGDFSRPGFDRPLRDCSPVDNLTRLREMRDAHHLDGSMVRRAKVDIASSNINMRDPTIYRLPRAEHYNTRDIWCIYPMYA